VPNVLPPSIALLLAAAGALVALALLGG